MSHELATKCFFRLQPERPPPGPPAPGPAARTARAGAEPGVCCGSQGCGARRARSPGAPGRSLGRGAGEVSQAAPETG